MRFMVRFLTFHSKTEPLNDTHSGFGKKMRQAGRVSGEAYLFGIDQGQVEPFMVRRGFTDIYNVTLEDLKPLYFTGSNAGRVLLRIKNYI